MKEIIVLLSLLLGPRWTVNEFAHYYGVSPQLAACIVRNESNYDTTLVSRDLDTGLYQIIPSTAEWAARKLGYVEYDLTNPIQNADMGTYILKHYPEWYSTLGMCK
jgi:soluble lytic murein transglycosylase